MNNKAKMYQNRDIGNLHNNREVFSTYIDDKNTEEVLSKEYIVRDVECVATFEMFGFHFIVHRALADNSYYNVTEASSGCYVMDYIYDSVQETLEAAIDRIKSKQYEFYTAISSMKVKSRKDLLNRNTILSTNELNLLWNL